MVQNPYVFKCENKYQLPIVTSVLMDYFQICFVNKIECYLESKYLPVNIRLILDISEPF